MPPTKTVKRTHTQQACNAQDGTHAMRRSALGQKLPERGEVHARLCSVSRCPRRQRFCPTPHEQAAAAAPSPPPTRHTQVSAPRGYSSWLTHWLALWHCGTAAPWHCGTAAPWHCGTVALWHCGTMALWHRGTVALWHRGTVALWHCGTVAAPPHTGLLLRIAPRTCATAPNMNRAAIAPCARGVRVIGAVRGLPTPQASEGRASWRCRCCSHAFRRPARGAPAGTAAAAPQRPAPGRSRWPLRPH